VGAYLTPANGTVVRGFLKVGGRVIVGPVRGVGADGVDIQTADAPRSARGTLWCAGAPGAPVVTWDADLQRAGAPGAPVVTWDADLQRIDGVVRVAWPDAGAAGVWPALRRLMGLDADAALPSANQEGDRDVEELPSSVPSEPGSMAPRAADPPSMAPGGWPVATLETLQAARTGNTRGVRTPVLHVPPRALAAALQRSPGELSPMIEIEGATGLRPRDVVAARVALADVTLYLEGTVVTARGTRARLRLAIPTEGARAALEQAR